MYIKLKHKFHMNISIVVIISSLFLAMLLDPPTWTMVCFVLFSLFFRALSYSSTYKNNKYECRWWKKVWVIPLFLNLND